MKINLIRIAKFIKIVFYFNDLIYNKKHRWHGIISMPSAHWNIQKILLSKKHK